MSFNVPSEIVWWSPWCQGSKSWCCWYQWRWREYGRNYTSWATRIAKLCPPGKNLSGPLTHITRYQPKCPKTSKGASKHLTTSFILRGCKDCQTFKKKTDQLSLQTLLSHYCWPSSPVVARTLLLCPGDAAIMIRWHGVIIRMDVHLSTVSRHDSDVWFNAFDDILQLKEREPTAGSGQQEPWPSYY